MVVIFEKDIVEHDELLLFQDPLLHEYEVLQLCSHSSTWTILGFFAPFGGYQRENVKGIGLALHACDDDIVIIDL